MHRPRPAGDPAHDPISAAQSLITRRRLGGVGMPIEDMVLTVSPEIRAVALGCVSASLEQGHTGRRAFQPGKGVAISWRLVLDQVRRPSTVVRRNLFLRGTIGDEARPSVGENQRCGAAVRCTARGAGTKTAQSRLGGAADEKPGSRFVIGPQVADESCGADQSPTLDDRPGVGSARESWRRGSATMAIARLGSGTARPEPWTDEVPGVADARQYEIRRPKYELGT
ncbi:hypothetical protein Micbo1qcDRAFT_172786 [Microdochium bolleyi]|uniref:Uncharacterized protein n=1 Tax=Microdochium bolleyi TaxID=196109 RepID=A0A136J9P7_9PEZI|nr:hypothetical protein Micbo1qcDRAFT_172786 [Microdochium bolleyi]